MLILCSTPPHSSPFQPTPAKVRISAKPWLDDREERESSSESMTQRSTEIVALLGATGAISRSVAASLFRSRHERADVKGFRFHDLRHTFATRLVQAGADIYTVQKLGRWKTIQMVMRYAHHYPESLRAGIEILDRVPAGVSTVSAQSANSAVESAGRESAVSC